MAAGDDELTRFLLPHAAVRGVHVRLGDAWRQILERNQYGPVVRTLLGEAVVATALLAGHAKVEGGRLSIQLRSQGPLRTLFAECTAAGGLRGIARLGPGSDDMPPDLREAGPDAVLAVTVEGARDGGREPLRYQGIVPLERDTLAGALEAYFDRSEQLPTCLVLAAGERSAAGVLLQQLPGEGDDPDGWNRASMLLGTVEGDELLRLSPDELLSRLFHLEDVALMGRQALGFACSCSRERVADMLESLGIEEARLALEDGMAEIACEFCGQRYVFDAGQIDAIFMPGGLKLPPSGSLH